MKLPTLSSMVIALLALPGAASAQGFKPIVDHIHLAAPEPEKAVAWYREHFGGQIMAEAVDRLLYGDTRIIFQRRPASLPSEGSSVDHIGFSVPNLDGAMKAFQTEGLKITQAVRDVPGLFKLAFIEDPWGTKIEVVQDSQKLGLHHIHLRGPDPAATLAWYAAQFGGRVGKLRDRIDGIEMTGVWLLAQKGDSTPSQGHAIDHIGFRPINLEASVAAMKAQNVKILTEPRPLKLSDGTMVQLAFAEGPDVVRIEMVQRPE
ncbi:MAG: VOC family protein [Vicinamibacterales bacterium]|nr:VOC family protein [Vicinamibacterales bacterium]